MVARISRSVERCNHCMNEYEPQPRQTPLRLRRASQTELTVTLKGCMEIKPSFTGRA